MQQCYGGRAVPERNIHLTLAFLGSVPVERINELRDIAQSIQVPRFQLDLTRRGCWKRSAVAWIAPDQTPASLASLALELQRRLREAGFRIDDKPFRPHVTLLRKAKCKPDEAQPAEPIVWKVGQFSLMRSETPQTGPVYTTIASWSL